MSELLEQRVEAGVKHVRKMVPLSDWQAESVVRAALLASDAVLAQAGMVVVPEAALKWLNGEGPDLDGYEFGERPDMPAGHRFWWRAVLRRWVSAAPSHPSDGGER
jgi:hypothetical protein